jgi:hypothetical protein
MDKPVLNMIWQTLDGDQTTFEFDYTVDILFKEFNQNRIFDNKTYSTILDNALIIYSNNNRGQSNDFLNYLNEYEKRGYNFFLLQYSNEDLNHDCSYYSKAKYVFRNYYDPLITQTNVKTLPLGVKSGYLNNNNDYSNSYNKKYDFSFIGCPKADRNDVFIHMMALNPEKIFLHKTHGWNCTTALSTSECIEIYKKTRFAPCPKGFNHPDSFRLMECLEWGAIPILRNYPEVGEKYINEIWGEGHPIPIVESWSEIKNYSEMSDSDYSALQNKVITWYLETKNKLANDIKNIIMM